MKEHDILPHFEPGLIKLEPIPKFSYHSDLKQELEANFLSEADAIRIFKVMLMNRYFEELIVEMKQGKFKPYENFNFIGATHLSIGQEAVAIGVMSALKWTDYITSTHRGHGHSIAKGAYRIFAMTRQEQIDFIGEDKNFSQLSDEAVMEHAMDHHIYKTMCELLGKEDGYCRGRGGGMHIADFNARHLGANAIVGGSYAIGAGAGLAQYLLKTGNVVATIVGDGAANNGIAHEAMNFTVQGQFEHGLPVIFVIENNQYGMTGQQAPEVTGIDYLAQRGAGYDKKNMNAEVVDGMNVLAVHDAIRRAAEKCRTGSGPALVECMTYRYMGHSLSDKRTSYRTPAEETAWKEKDAVEQFRRQLSKSGVLSETEIDEIQSEIDQKIRDITLKAALSQDPRVDEIYDGLWTSTTSDKIDPKWQSSDLLRPVRKIKRIQGGKILVRHAVWEALAEEMRRDKRVVVYGEDVADYGGAFGVTMGLLETFGRDRVFNAPISEAAIVGTACGAAMTGLRPVAEIMYIDFIPLALDQLGNQVAKARYMFGGKAKIPMVLRTTIGGGKGYAGQHSQSLEAIIAHFPGLKVAAPFTAHDAKGLLKTAIRDDNPVVFIEHQMVYADLGEVPEPDEELLIPFGQANILRQGSDITLISYSNLLKNTLQAAEMLNQQHDIEAEVIDLRTLVPLDAKKICASVEKTGHCAVIIQAPLTCSFAEHVAYKIQRESFTYLKKPIEIVPAYSVPPPMAAPLENENIPSANRIARAALSLLGR
ncbi:dehydrogenase E1 component subunit alpha/beta [candidate division KSB1 bacterium]|nr:dehydrogenase E1 component subunit alpha/beta [candidate division KSB1 bacterium]